MCVCVCVCACVCACEGGRGRGGQLPVCLNYWKRQIHNAEQRRGKETAAEGGYLPIVSCSLAMQTNLPSSAARQYPTLPNSMDGMYKQPPPPLTHITSSTYICGLVHNPVPYHVRTRVCISVYKQLPPPPPSPPLYVASYITQGLMQAIAVSLQSR